MRPICYIVRVKISFFAQIFVKNLSMNKGASSLMRSFNAR